MNSDDNRNRAVYFSSDSNLIYDLKQWLEARGFECLSVEVIQSEFSQEDSVKIYFLVNRGSGNRYTNLAMLLNFKNPDTETLFINYHHSEDLLQFFFTNKIHSLENQNVLSNKGSFSIPYLKNKDRKFLISEALLTDTNLNIRHISELLGFSTKTSFFRYFKEITGLSPRQFRKNLIFQNALKRHWFISRISDPGFNFSREFIFS